MSKKEISHSLNEDNYIRFTKSDTPLNAYHNPANMLWSDRYFIQRGISWLFLRGIWHPLERMPLSVYQAPEVIESLQADLVCISQQARTIQQNSSHNICWTINDRDLGNIHQPFKTGVILTLLLVGYVVSVKMVEGVMFLFQSV